MTNGSAGMDLCADLKGELTLAPMERALIPTGVAIALPAGFEAQIRPRSGLALNQGLTMANSPGTIDSDYRGEIQLIADQSRPRAGGDSARPTHRSNGRSADYSGALARGSRIASLGPAGRRVWPYGQK